MNAIEVDHVTKTYRRYGRRRHFGTLKSALLSGRFFRDLRPDEVLQALNDVSFHVEAGRTFGIIGRNGSGKSTMLKLIAGIGKPTSGRVHVQGRVSALIELGAGFHPEITGRENVFINGMMLGMSKRAIAERFDEIVAFAELEDFIDAPVKTYSSGMYMRLGFAVAINVNPDVLLVDEVLAVGDQAFTHKCLEKFEEFRRSGRTILIVTHSLDVVARFCDQALWLDQGRICGQGPPDQVIDAYLSAVATAEQAAPESPAARLQEARVLAVTLRDAEDQPITTIASGGRLVIHMRIRVARLLDDVAFSFAIVNVDGIRCCAANTVIDGLPPVTLEAGEHTVTCTLDPLPLVMGSYALDVAVLGAGTHVYDNDHRTTFTVTSPWVEAGIFHPPRRWSFGESVQVPTAGGDEPVAGERS
jgi:ABC-type polysaccharide/polyol phosphate transport system ATPase subunit